MGRFESNALAPRYRHHPPRDSRDLDGRLSGSLAAFKFAISAHFKKSTADSFRKDFAPRPILLFQKMRGWLSSAAAMASWARRAGLASSVMRPHHRRAPAEGRPRRRPQD